MFWCTFKLWLRLVGRALFTGLDACCGVAIRMVFGAVDKIEF